MEIIKENVFRSYETPYAKGKLSNTKLTNSVTKKKKALADVGNTLHVKGLTDYKNANVSVKSTKSPFKLSQSLNKNEKLTISEPKSRKAKVKNNAYNDPSVDDTFFTYCRCSSKYSDMQEEPMFPKQFRLTDKDFDALANCKIRSKNLPETINLSPIKLLDTNCFLPDQDADLFPDWNKDNALSSDSMELNTYLDSIIDSF